MASILDKVKPAVKAISAYTLREYDYDLKMNQNENPDDVPAALKEKVLDFARDRSWSRYPPFIPMELRERLAEYAGWRADGVLVGNGSNEIIQALMTVFLGQGKRLVIPSPTFTVYRLLATVLGAEVEQVPLKPDYTYDCDALESAFFDRGDMVVICSPNNPTGALYPPERIAALLEKTDEPVIVDEAYYEFSGVTVKDLLARHDNLVVLRTFSKAFSLAGLRVGYGMMDPSLALEVDKAKLPYNINFFSIAAALMLLENRAELAESVRRIVAEREPMIRAMSAIDGVIAYPSSSNFILFETPYTPKRVFEGVLADGILIRDVSSYPMLEKALRVSVSTADDNRRFLDSLARVIRDLKKETA